MELNGSRVLVTGASGGIGEALVEQLCKAGAQVLAVGRDADKLAAAQGRFPHALRALVADLAQAYLKADTSIAALVRATLTHPEFEASVGRKWRRPLEFVSSIARAAQVSRYQPKAAAGSEDLYNTGLYGYLIRIARHTPRAWTVVNGYPDQASFWNSTSITLSLWNGAQDAVIGDKVESGMTSWTRALSIKAGDNALATARRITWHLTGYQWPEPALLKVAGLLAHGTADGVDASAVVSPTYTDDYAAQAVRVTFASPYGFLR